MTRARELAKLANSSVFNVDSSNNVGINSSTPDAKLDVVGVVSATQYFGDGSNLTGIVAGATLNASSGTQRLVVTSQTSGSMTQAATNADIAYNTSTNTLSATNFSGTLLGNATGLQGTPSITVQDVAAEKVSIAGTISYEDVTNVNSVGIITANKGIKVPNYGMTVTGVVTATSYQGDGSSLTGVESGVSNFVASGAIGNGDTVIIKTDGTVTVVAGVTISETVGSPVTIGSYAIYYIGSAFDPSSGKVVVAYRDSGNNKGAAKVGTVSGSSISFGDSAQFESGSPQDVTVAFGGNGKVVIAYQQSASPYYGKARVGTISGTSISFGTEVTFESGNTSNIGMAYASNNKVVISYRDGGNNGYGTAVVGTISGTSISFGSPVVFNTAGIYYSKATYDSANSKVVIAYRDDGNNGYGTARVGTVSGSSISFGAKSVFSSDGQTNYMDLTYDSINQKIVIAYGNWGNSQYGTAIVGNVSGTSISFGSAVIYNTAQSAMNAITFDASKGKVVVVYRDDGNSSYGTIIPGTVSGTSITFGNEVVFESAQSNNMALSYDSTNEKVVIAYTDSGNSDYGKAVVYGPGGSSTNLTAENYIGIAAEAIANGATGKITTIGGINSGQTGLTAAQTYYIQNNGSLATSAGDPSVVAGTSISSTKILIR